MSKETENFALAGRIQSRETGFRALLGGAAMVAVLAGALPETSQIFAATLFSMYMVVTAITGVDPIYALSEKLADRINSGGMGKHEKHARRRLQAIPVHVQQHGRS